MKKTNKISKIALKSNLRKVYKKDNSFKSFVSKDIDNSNNFNDISQASACDIIITKLLLNKVNVNNIYKACIDYVEINNVYMKNYSNNKALVIARLKRHLTSDNLQRLSKRSISLT